MHEIDKDLEYAAKQLLAAFRLPHVKDQYTNMGSFKFVKGVLYKKTLNAIRLIMHYNTLLDIKENLVDPETALTDWDSDNMSVEQDKKFTS